MVRQRTIAVVTGSRAEFGLLETVLRAIDEHRRLLLKTIVAGLHLTTGSWRDVADAGFKIDERVTMQRKREVGRHADVQAVARGIAGFGKAFAALKPDVVVVLGDRIEAFAAAAAASVGGMRLAHIHGGDRAEGVADEAMRHAISKLAHIHFAATATSRRRLIRLGEQPSNVLNVGSPAIDALRHPIPRRKDIGFVIMLHPIGDTDQNEAGHIRNVLKAVKQTSRKQDDKATNSHYVFNPNADPGSAGIIRVLDQQVPLRENVDASATSTFKRVKHMPRDQFLEVLNSADAIIGNSSAGLIEAAALKTPCVNIGPRQNGREKPDNVIDCKYETASIATSIKRAMKLDVRTMRHPYGNGSTGPKIAEYLANVALTNVPVRKQNAY